MAVTLNIPSQVKTYANLAAFPASGSLKTIYIAEDTNKTYRWDGSTYVEISASASGLTVGTTPIASGTIGRVLFQGTGNVLQQSSSLFWDNTNARLELTTADNVFATFLKASTGQLKIKPYLNPTFGVLMESRNAADSAYLPFTISGSKIQLVDGNVLINTTTDGGFKTDINGTLRVVNNSFFATTGVGGNGVGIGTTTLGTIDPNQRLLQINANLFPSIRLNAGPNIVISEIVSNASSNWMYIGTSTNHPIVIATNNTERVRIFASGNVGINTTIDAGFKTDINGSARVTTLRSDNPVIGFAPSTAGVLIGSNQVYRIICDGSSYYDFRTNAGVVYRLRDDGSTSFGSTTIAASAMVDIQSTTKGFLPPRGTNAQMLAIASPATGLIFFDITNNKLNCYDGTTWQPCW